MPLRKHLSSIFSLSLRMMTVVSSFLFSWIVARLFGVEDSGTVFFYITILTIIVTVSSHGADLGITKAVARIGSNDLTRIDALFKYVIKKSSFYYLALLPILFLYLVYEGNELKTSILLFLVLALTGAAFLYMNILSYLYQGLGNILMMILSQRTFFNFIAFVILGVIALYYHQYTEAKVISNLYQITIIMLAALISFFVFFCYYKSTQLYSKVGYAPAGFVSSCRELFKIQGMQLVTMYGSQIMINFFASRSDIAGFIISQRISTLLGFFVLAVSSVISSKISKYYSSGDIASVQTYAFQSFVFASVLGLPVALMLLLFSDESLSLFGQDFQQYSMVLMILVASQVVNCLTGASDITLMFIDGEKEHRVNVVVGTVAAILLCLLLIPFYSAIGAAIATSVSAVLVNILDVIAIKKKAGFWIFIYKKFELS